MDFSERMLELARAKAPGIRFEAGNALALPYGDGEFDAVTVGFGARNFSDLAARPAPRWRASRGPGGRVVVLEITTPQKPPLSWFFRLWFDRVVPRARPPRGRLRRLHLPAELRPPLPGPAGAGRRAGGGRARRRALGAHGRRHHRAARRARCAPVSGAPPGAARPAGARRRRPAAGRGARAHRGAPGGGGGRARAGARGATRAACSPRAASACGRCSCSSPRPTTRTSAWWPPPWRWSCCTWPRSCTTTCSTARRCAAAAPPSSPPAGARPPPPPATCSSRARSRSWPAPAAARP